MLLLPIIALLAGFALFYAPLHGYTLAANIAPYTAIALLAGLDTVLGGWRAWLDNNFDDAVFISGFFVNSLLAAGLVALGERLGLQAGLGEAQISIMMIGAVVVFSSRIFTNLAVLRRLLIDRLRGRFARSSTSGKQGSEDVYEATDDTPARAAAPARIR